MKQTPSANKTMSNINGEETDNHHEFEISLEEEKCEETEIKMKEDKDRVRDKNEKAFFIKLQERLADKNDKVYIDTKGSDNQGVALIRRLSVNIPYLVDIRNTLTIQQKMFDKKDTLFIKKVEEEVKRQQKREEKDDIQKIKHEAEMDLKKHKEIQKALEKFLDSTAVVVIMALVTIFVLIGDDIKSLFLPWNYDYGFDCTKTFCFAVFIMEIILSCAAKKEYILSFFFWLDLVSTFSLIQDIGFIIDPMVYGNTE